MITNYDPSTVSNEERFRLHEEAETLSANDILYHNVPMEPVTGVDAIRDVLAIMEDGEWIVHRQIAAGDVVMNERTDRLKVNGKWVELPVAGVFEVHDGRVTLWRDYFDLQTMMTALQPGT